MKKHRLAKFVLIPICGAALVTLVIYLVMSLWNWLVPELFNGPAVSFWQAAGILLLSKILFGFGKGGKCSRCGGPGAHWKNSWKERWKEKWKEKYGHLSEEEKEQMKNRWKQCWWGEDKPSDTPNA